MSNTNDLVLHLKLDTIIPDADNQRVRSAFLSENVSALSENISASTESQYSVHGSPQVVSDEHFGSCFIFDGRQDYIEIPNSEDINFATNQDFTVASWIKIAKEQPFKTNGDNDIIEKWDGSGGYPYVIRYCRDEKKILAARYDGSNHPSVTTTTELNSEQFYHIAFVKEGNQLRLYLDGREESSTDDTTQSTTQNNSPLYLARRGGGSEYANYFKGAIANLRIYKKALSPEEIKEDMNNDLTAIAAFNLAYPLDFNLYEGDNQESVIFIENDTKGEELVLEIKNNTEQGITLPAKSGAVSQNNYHFELRFRPDTLSPKSLQQLTLNPQSNWSMSSPVTQADGIVSLYFLTTNATLSANEVVTLTFQNVSASAAGGARTTRVEFLCPEFTYQGETLTNYYREKTLSVIDHRGKKNIPLHVSFVGSNRILNDGTTTNKLTLRIVNVLKDKSIPLIPDSKGDQASKFIISFDVQEANQNKDWALGTTSQVQGIGIQGKDFRLMARHIEEWKIVKETQGESPTWTITNQNEENVELRQEQGIELTINNIISSLPSGQTNLYIRYENIPGYWDGTFICTIEKSPIIYDNQGNVGIGISDPGKFKLNVQGGDINVSGTIYRGGNPLIYENYEIYLRGSAFESPEGNNTFLKIANVAITMTNNRGLNTVILRPNGSDKKGTYHDVYANQDSWNDWANWINDPNNVAEGDVVAVASYDAIRNAPRGGSAERLLTSINALRAFTVGQGKGSQDTDKARLPYVLLFIKGRAGAMEVCLPYRGPNAHLKTTYYELWNYGNTLAVAVLTGMIMMWAGDRTQIPDGWLICDGREIPPDHKYDNLRTLINSNNTPNLCGRTLIGAGGKYSPGQTGGEETHQLTVEEMPIHHHNYHKPKYNYGHRDGGEDWTRYGHQDQKDDDSTTQSGGSVPHNNMQPYYVVIYVIKY
jgi:microcystin-dependent protein